MASVCAALGIHVDSNGYAPCPFHQDHRPSFNLYADAAGVQRWGCFPCGIGGDAFDLVQRVRVVGFGEAVRFVSEVSKNVPDAVPSVRAELDVAGLSTYVLQAQANARLDVNRGLLCVAASMSVEPSLELDRRLLGIGWGVDDAANVVMPHWSGAGQLTGCKVRSLDGHRWSFPGSRYENLYGAWRPVASRDLVLCEGESDFAHAVDRANGADVRSLPTGAGDYRGAWVTWSDWINERYGAVYLGFDADDAGDGATRWWSESLTLPKVRVLPVPRGQDLRSCGIQIGDLMNAAAHAG